MILLYAYDKYGFLHLDLHLGNILYKTYNKNIKLNYIINNNPIFDGSVNISIISDFKLIIIDYNNCISYDPKIFSKYDPEFIKSNKKTYLKDNRLFNKIVIMFQESTKLLDSTNEYNMLNKLNEYINSNDFKLVDSLNKKDLRNYHLGRHNYEFFLSKDSYASIRIAQKLFEIVTDNSESLFTKFDLI
jgi:predicted unusual protein kinase regulating ubiquinone biosynthesis (AarF/ABC1/UbiB family)